MYFCVTLASIIKFISVYCISSSPNDDKYSLNYRQKDFYKRKFYATIFLKWMARCARWFLQQLTTIENHFEQETAFTFWVAYKFPGVFFFLWYSKYVFLSLMIRKFENFSNPLQNTLLCCFIRKYTKIHELQKLHLLQKIHENTCITKNTFHWND